MGDVEDTIEMIEGRTTELDSNEEQLKEVVLESLGSNVKEMREILNSIVGKLTERDDAFETMTMTLKEETLVVIRALICRNLV
ncbi:hypothetical protein J1N35_022490 [Gossypium stocksii]|uniref:Uncharacterized protein n=1 Tax=Gossypium stocksii TaxID=47602 RepID=A0A9D3VIL0_9ROSI|nr:hypothetical protein J1N35_022490 [Gossypium stocksii]